MSPSVTAQRIHRALFDREIPSELQRRFDDAWEVLQEDYSSRERAAASEAIEAVRDLEALELACRRRDALPALASQIRLMVMLGETLPTHWQFYVASRPGRLRGLLALPVGCFRTAWKLLKGRVLLRRFHER